MNKLLYSIIFCFLFIVGCSTPNDTNPINNIVVDANGVSIGTLEMQGSGYFVVLSPKGYIFAITPDGYYYPLINIASGTQANINPNESVMYIVQSSTIFGINFVQVYSDANSNLSGQILCNPTYSSLPGNYYMAGLTGEVSNDKRDESAKDYYYVENNTQTFSYYYNVARSCSKEETGLPDTLNPPYKVQ